MKSLCPACLRPDLELLETVSVDALAAAWAQGGRHQSNATQEQIRTFIAADLETQEVRFRGCRACGLEVADPMRSWSAGHYPPTHHVLGYDHHVALARLAARPPVRLLDIGCADGQFLEKAQALGHEVAGIDFTVADIQSARQRGIDAHVADVAELKRIFAGRSTFEVVTLFQIIEHLNEPDEIFEQIATITAPGSTLIVGCPSDRRYSRIFSHSERVERSDFWDYPPQHTLRWTAAALKTFLSRHGWKVEETHYEPYSVLPVAAHMAALSTQQHGFKPRSLRNRIEILRWLFKSALARIVHHPSGIRQLVIARR